MRHSHSFSGNWEMKEIISGMKKILQTNRTISLSKSLANKAQDLKPAVEETIENIQKEIRASRTNIQN